MRNTFYAILCLGLAGCAMAAGNLILGERVEGDSLVTERIIFKPAIPGKSMMARLSATAEGNITFINATNLLNSAADFLVTKGGVGTTEVMLIAVSQPGEGMLIHLQVFGIVPTEEEPTDPEVGDSLVGSDPNVWNPAIPPVLPPLIPPIPPVI